MLNLGVKEGHELLGFWKNETHISTNALLFCQSLLHLQNSRLDRVQALPPHPMILS